MAGTGKFELSRRSDLFDRGEWATLITDSHYSNFHANGPLKTYQADMRQKGERALSSVQLGEVSRARQN